ncbi:tyrosine-type recombinase/integrase [Streptomyces sp. NPDC002795]|uniref:tyrosine-type recombinase/integrase n=1 Tax=Streptomyces sp. NPDC002795 TaxID=3364665 RepID=UPI0036A2126C
MFEPTYKKQCGCVAPVLDDKGQPVLDNEGSPKQRRLYAQCPDLKSPRHGKWSFNLELEEDGQGERQRVRRSGFATKGDAATEARKVYDRAQQGVIVETRVTVADYLDEWLERKRKLAPSTAHAYSEHIEDYLKPYLGAYQLPTLRPRHIEQMFDAIIARNEEVAENQELVAGLRAAHEAAKAHRRTLLDASPAQRRSRADRAVLDEERRTLRKAWRTATDELTQGRKAGANTGQVHALAEKADAAKAAWQEHVDRFGTSEALTGSREERDAQRIARAEARQAVSEAWAALVEARGLRLRKTGPATMRRIRDTLSSALNTAVKRGEGVTRNWASMIELPDQERPKAEVWTPALMAKWRETGVRPVPVMVWTPELTGRFLDSVIDDPHYPLWHLLVFRGPRRGEAAGLRWDTGVNLQTREIHIVQQFLRVGKTVILGKPKADSTRTMSMDEELHRLLTAEKIRQESAKNDLAELGVPWADSGHVFVDEVGQPVTPEWITRRFLQLIEAADLPPIRLHDLRHGSATLALAGGVEMKVVSKRLGHSSLQITSDTYTHVLPQLLAAEAEAVVAVVPRAANPQKSPRVTKAKDLKPGVRATP